MEEIKKIIKTLRTRGRSRQQLIYRYGIVDPVGLAGLQLRRFSVFNDHPSFSIPGTTPRLYLFS